MVEAIIRRREGVARLEPVNEAFHDMEVLGRLRRSMDGLVVISALQNSRPGDLAEVVELLRVVHKVQRHQLRPAMLKLDIRNDLPSFVLRSVIPVGNHGGVDRQLLKTHPREAGGLLTLAREVVVLYVAPVEQVRECLSNSCFAATNGRDGDEDNILVDLC